MRHAYDFPDMQLQSREEYLARDVGAYLQRKCRSGVQRGDGAWGVSVTECWAVLTAERLYTTLIGETGPSLRAPLQGQVIWRLPSGPATVSWELRPNSVRPGCRRCFCLTYESRQQNNYKGGELVASFWLSARFLAYVLTESAREDRAIAAAERQAERTAIRAQHERHAG